jgi:hypothetical protein
LSKERGVVQRTLHRSSMNLRKGEDFKVQS